MCRKTRLWLFFKFSLRTLGTTLLCKLPLKFRSGYNAVHWPGEASWWCSSCSWRHLSEWRSSGRCRRIRTDTAARQVPRWWSAGTSGKHPGWTPGASRRPEDTARASRARWSCTWSWCRSGRSEWTAGTCDRHSWRCWRSIVHCLSTSLFTSPAGHR